jgi:hypothetical protein
LGEGGEQGIVVVHWGHWLRGRAANDGLDDWGGNLSLGLFVGEAEVGEDRGEGLAVAVGDATDHLDGNLVVALVAAE